MKQSPKADIGTPALVYGTSQWYLIALDGDMVLRVRPGMPLGETAAGELSFDPCCAQLELDIADDGGLVLCAAADHELEFDGGTRCRYERLTRDRRPEIRLPHNVLRLVTDFVHPAQADGTVEIRATRTTAEIAQTRIARESEAPVPVIAEPQIERVQETPVWAIAEPPVERAPDAAVPVIAEPQIERLSEAPPDTHAVVAVPRRIAVDLASRLQEMLGSLLALLVRLVRRRSGAELESPGDAATGLRTHPIGARSEPIRAAALIGVRGLGLVLLLSGVYLVLRDGSVPEAPTAVSVEPPARTAPPQVVQTVAGSVDPAPAAPPAVVPSASTQQPIPASGRPSVIEPKPPSKVAKPRTERLREPALAVAPAAENLAQPRAKRPSEPKVEETSSAEATVASPPAVAGPPDVAAVTQIEAPSAPIQPRTVDLARALFAADQALAQGQLTTPPEANAYALYSRVLTLDPDSAEARGGLQSVRQGLINRALAQLAGGALEDARMSLQEAANAGADPLLISNLREEVNHRERLINARAEQDAGQDE